MSPLFGRSATSSRRNPGSSSTQPVETPGHAPDEGGPRSARDDDDALVFRAAAMVLAYPEDELRQRLAVIAAALAGTRAAEQFAPVIAHLSGAPLREVQSFHVQEFDLSRKHALHLTYWTDGDTRRRGNVLAEIKQTYRDSGLLVDTGGELPDYLPMVLEFAVADPNRGRGLLQRFRASLELIRLGLVADRLPHAGVLEAICDRLPGDSPQSRAEVQARFGEVQPVELVGLEPFRATTGIPAFAGVTQAGMAPEVGMTVDARLAADARVNGEDVVPGPNPGTAAADGRQLR